MYHLTVDLAIGACFEFQSQRKCRMLAENSQSN